MIRILDPPNSDYYESIKDVPHYHHNPQSKIINLHLQIYNDAFGITRNTNTKNDIFYFTILNLPYWMQSARDDIYMFLVCKSNIVKETYYESLVEYLIEDIQNINREPIKLTNDYEVKLILHSNAADNEASNKMMGIDGFKAKFCKGCNVHQNQLNTLYSGSFNFVENKISNRTTIPDTHAFNKLDKNHFFNLLTFYTFDPFHDFASSGFMLKILRPMILIYYIEGTNFRKDLKAFKIKKYHLFAKFKKLNHRNGMISDIDNDGNIIFELLLINIEFNILF